MMLPRESRPFPSLEKHSLYKLKLKTNICANTVIYMGLPVLIELSLKKTSIKLVILEFVWPG